MFNAFYSSLQGTYSEYSIQKMVSPINLYNLDKSTTCIVFCDLVDLNVRSIIGNPHGNTLRLCCVTNVCDPTRKLYSAV